MIREHIDRLNDLLQEAAMPLAGAIAIGCFLYLVLTGGK